MMKTKYEPIDLVQSAFGLVCALATGAFCYVAFKGDWNILQSGIMNFDVWFWIILGVAAILQWTINREKRTSVLERWYPLLLVATVNFGTMAVTNASKVKIFVLEPIVWLALCVEFTAYVLINVFYEYDVEQFQKQGHHGYNRAGLGLVVTYVVFRNPITLVGYSVRWLFRRFCQSKTSRDKTVGQASSELWKRVTTLTMRPVELGADGKPIPPAPSANGKDNKKEKPVDKPAEAKDGKEKGGFKLPFSLPFGKKPADPANGKGTPVGGDAPEVVLASTTPATPPGPKPGDVKGDKPPFGTKPGDRPAERPDQRVVEAVLVPEGVGVGEATQPVGPANTAPVRTADSGNGGGGRRDDRGGGSRPPFNGGGGGKPSGSPK